MKRKICLWMMSVVCLLTACTTRSYPPSLQRADSLASACPEQALAYLDSLSPDTASFPLAHRMYYRLLCIKAADKAYILHTSDSLIRPVLHYYIEDGDPRLLPEAYYYAGRVYRDLGDVPHAITCFERALNAMSESENGKVESKIYAQMGTLFLYLGLYEEAKRMFVQSYRCDSILKDSVGMIFNYRDIANCYRRQNQPDSALHYFRQADVWSRETGRTVMQRGIQSQLASLYLDNGVTDSAYAALSVALQNVERPDSSGIYTIAGRYYMQVNQPDSARWYYTQLLDFGNAYSKEAACEVLLDMAIQDGNLPLIKVYRPMQRRYADSVKQLTQTEAVYRVHSLFNYNRQEKKNARLEAENARYERNSALIGAISLLLIGVLMSIGLYQRRQQKILKRRLQQVNRLRKETGRQSDVAIEEYKRHIRDLEQRLADSEQESNTVREELQMERERYHAWIKQTEIIRKQREEAEQVFPDTVIFQTLKKKTQTIRRGEVKVTSQEWEALKTQIGLYYPSFFEKLDSLCYEFKENEIRINLLIKVGFNPTEIGILLGCSVQTISTWRRRLTERILNKEKAKPTDWDEFIRAL